MAQTAGLIFTNDSGAGSGTSTYVQDTLPDYTFPPSNNTGFSSTVSNNPLGNNYANTDLPQYGAKYLPIKDLILLQDRSKWIGGKTTYQVVFYENFPQVQAYVFGNIQVNYSGVNPSVLIKTVGDGISVNGVIRQVAFVLQPNTAATATAQVSVDGVNGNTIDFSSYTTATPTAPINNAFSAFVHNTALETYNIHDIRLTANQASTLSVNGLIIYFQNSGSNIDQFPGSSYVNKSKVTTTLGATLSVPSFGSSLGGNFTIYKTGFSGYTTSALSATTIASTASGSSGTNLLNLAAGTGASFVAGYGLVVTQGASTYVGNVISVSTDTLTMGNTLGFGITAGSQVYTAWKAGNTLSINASLMTRAVTIDFPRINPVNGFSNAILDPNGRYAVWGNNVGITLIDGFQCAFFNGASGFLQVDGYFSAAEVETIGAGIFSATFSVNGLSSWSQQSGQTGVVKKTVFTDAGPGWNSFNIGCGASMGMLGGGGSPTLGPIGFQRINLYQRSRDFSVSFGVLSDYDIAQTYTKRDATNATLMAIGPVQRVYADQLYFKNTWIRGQTWTVPGGAYYQGASTNGSLSFQYYGTHFGIIGSISAGSTLTLDTVPVGLTANIMQTVATLGFHTIQYTGGTALIAAIDYVTPIMKSAVDAVSTSMVINLLPAYRSPTIVTLGSGHGTSVGTYNAPEGCKFIRVKMVGAGGGGGGSGNAAGSNGQAGAVTSFGTSLLICGPGGGGGDGANGAIAGAGGTFIISKGVSGWGVIGSAGQPATGDSAANVVPCGGSGGAGPYGGAGAGGVGGVGANGVGGSGADGSGSGGGGGSANGLGGGAGGGSGGYIEATIPNPHGAFPWQVGGGAATGGNAGTTGNAGGDAGAGLLVIEENY